LYVHFHLKKRKKREFNVHGTPGTSVGNKNFSQTGIKKNSTVIRFIFYCAEVNKAAY
jgi:hypothetical protein